MKPSQKNPKCSLNSDELEIQFQNAEPMFGSVCNRCKAEAVVFRTTSAGVLIPQTILWKKKNPPKICFSCWSSYCSCVPVSVPLCPRIFFPFLFKPEKLLLKFCLLMSQTKQVDYYQQNGKYYLLLYLEDNQIHYHFMAYGSYLWHMGVPHR